MRGPANIGIAVAAILLSACSGPAGPAPATTPKSDAKLQTVLSTASPKPSIDLNFDFGQFVIVTDDAFVPKQLISAVDKPVTWINRTGRSIVLRFDNYGGLVSPPIPGGESWSFTPSTTVSIVYHAESPAGMRGAVQVQPTVEP